MVAIPDRMGDSGRSSVKANSRRFIESKRARAWSFKTLGQLAIITIVISEPVPLSVFDEVSYIEPNKDSEEDLDEVSYEEPNKDSKEELGEEEED